MEATGLHTWSETAPTCTQDGVKTCTVCGKQETSAALGHNWIHHDEEGHWQEVLTCYCSAQFYSYEDWYNHSNASPDFDWHDAHAGYEVHDIWVIDTVAYDFCSRCGATR